MALPNGLHGGEKNNAVFPQVGDTPKQVCLASSLILAWVCLNVHVMPQNTTKYDQQRRKVTPPHVPLTGVRIALGMTQAEVCKKVELALGKSFTKGALSAIENGHRGASAEVLTAIGYALGLPAGSLVTDYAPTHSRTPDTKRGVAA